MQVFIPTEIEGLEGLLQAMRTTQLNKILSKIRETGPCDSLSLHLPKFKIESTFNLAEPLKQVRRKLKCFKYTKELLKESSHSEDLYSALIIVDWSPCNVLRHRCKLYWNQ